MATYESLLNNELVSFSELANAVSTGALIQKASFSSSSECVTRTDAETYVYVNTLSSLATNEEVTKLLLNNSAPLTKSCGTSAGYEFLSGQKHYVKYTVGTTSGASSVAVNYLSGSGGITVKVYYEGAQIASQAITGTTSVPFTFIYNTQNYVIVEFTCTGTGVDFTYNVACPVTLYTVNWSFNYETVEEIIFKIQKNGVDVVYVSNMSDSGNISVTFDDVLSIYIFQNTFGNDTTSVANSIDAFAGFTSYGSAGSVDANTSLMVNEINQNITIEASSIGH